MRFTLTAWHRETFAVHIFPSPGNPGVHRAELVKGFVSGPFGVYAGSLYHVGHTSSGGRKTYSLVHLATQNVQLTLPRAGLRRQAAQELAECDLAWESAWVLGVVGPIEEMEKARDIHAKWKSWGRRRSWGER